LQGQAEARFEDARIHRLLRADDAEVFSHRLGAAGVFLDARGQGGNAPKEVRKDSGGRRGERGRHGTEGVAVAGIVLVGGPIQGFLCMSRRLFSGLPNARRLQSGR